MLCHLLRLPPVFSNVHHLLQINGSMLLPTSCTKNCLKPLGRTSEDVVLVESGNVGDYAYLA